MESRQVTMPPQARWVLWIWTGRWVIAAHCATREAARAKSRKYGCPNQILPSYLKGITVSMPEPNMKGAERHVPNK